MLKRPMPPKKRCAACNDKGRIDTKRLIKGVWLYNSKPCECRKGAYAR